MVNVNAEISGKTVDFIASLQKICGSDAVNTDHEDLRYYSQDLFFEGHLPIVVASPSTTEQVVEIVRLCRAEAIPVYLRGGGMSYTNAFQPGRDGAMMIDFSNLSAIREISVDDGHVTVEAGCSWAVLDAALAKHGVRTRFWGPMSGATATIGGSMSQGTVTFGSGGVGASANAVKSFEIVSGLGEVIRTGSDGTQGTSPFNRNFGPDLTGIFANDAGALGIKTAITLELEPRPEHVSGLSFAYDDFERLAQLFGAIAGRRLASEMIAVDYDVARQNAGPANLVEDAKAAWRIGKAAGNPLSALVRIGKIAVGGRDFMKDARYTAHFVVEGRDRAALGSRIRAIRSLAKTGREIVNTVPLMIRANPFPLLPVTHPDGRRMLPVHGVFPPSAISGFHRAYLQLKASHQAELQQSGVSVAEYFAGVSGIGMLYEPVFYWSDSLNAYHHRKNPDSMARVAAGSENLSARKLVEDMIARFNALVHAHGGTHFQIGRLYPYAQNRTGGAERLLRDLKLRLDPDNIINPGALGL